MDATSPSGMYKCTICNEVKAHIKGDEFTPCQKCNKNSWIIIPRDWIPPHTCSR